MKKVLLVTTISGFVPQFEMNNVRLLQQMGCEVHYASNYDTPSYGKDNSRLDGTGIIRHQIDFVRSPYSIKNKKVLRQLKELMRREHFDLIHCHTPMGSVMARLAAHATGTGPLIYTAHGFHFFRGASLVNWLFYYPVEWWLSRYTNQLICINQEDYRRAKRFRCDYVDYIPGAGINTERVKKAEGIDKIAKKKELGLPPDKKIFLSVGELIPRKNHESVIEAIKGLQDDTFLYLICGQGELLQHLKELVQKNSLQEKVLFIGYRPDVLEICQIADCFIFPSYQEGLPMAMLEAMASGLPVICSMIRGNIDLMEADMRTEKSRGWYACAGGILVNKADDVIAYREAMEECILNEHAFSICGERNKAVVNTFSQEQVEQKMIRIYKRMIK